MSTRDDTLSREIDCIVVAKLLLLPSLRGLEVELDRNCHDEEADSRPIDTSTPPYGQLV